MTIAHLLPILFLLLCTQTSFAEPIYQLDDLLKLAQEANRSLIAGRDHVNAARSAVQSASALPNPELELGTGSIRARSAGVNTGSSHSISLTQPLDLPHVRQPRIGAANAVLDATQASQHSLEADVQARIRTRFYELLRREAELNMSKENQKLLEDIRHRIALRVSTGESPRFELIKAEAEVLNAQKHTVAMTLRLDQARAQLRQAVGTTILPSAFAISGKLDQIPVLPPLEDLHQEMMRNNPELSQSRAEIRRATSQLKLEQAQRWPNVAVKASWDQDPDINAHRIGVVASLPLWNRREGLIAEAKAHVERANHDLADREFTLAQTLVFAYQQYEIAQTQVAALQTGIVREAENALKVAEAAYRFGERGILEVLDAQRVFQSARNELIAARYEQAAAWVEIERLRATHL